MSRPFAAFDIDGTLIRWQLYHALADELAHAGKLDAAEFQAVRQARMTWKTRSHQHSFQDYERSLIELIDQVITTIPVSEFEAACQHVLDEYKDQVYTFTRDLIHRLRAKNYLLFAISASQSQIVKLVAEYYGFDDAGGSEYVIKDGYFTGERTLLKSESKPQFLKTLVEKHKASWQGSIAVGDSESDIPMLEVVDQPIALNPTKKLFEHATKAGWKVVLERKNMVYELENVNGRYQLAKTNS